MVAPAVSLTNASVATAYPTIESHCGFVTTKLNAMPMVNTRSYSACAMTCEKGLTDAGKDLDATPQSTNTEHRNESPRQAPRPSEIPTGKGAYPPKSTAKGYSADIMHGARSRRCPLTACTPRTKKLATMDVKHHNQAVPWQLSDQIDAEILCKISRTLICTTTSSFDGTRGLFRPNFFTGTNVHPVRSHNEIARTRWLVSDTRATQTHSRWSTRRVHVHAS